MDHTNNFDWMYNQSGVIPFRRIKDELQILLITSRSRKRWVIPKGIIEPELSPQESAQKEALEEAGITGKIINGALGTYSYKKWGGTCTVQVFLLEVEEIFDEWAEAYFRTREWISVEEASKRVDEKELKKLILAIPGNLKNAG
jgi:8-oxo-dGTP pyrophosphatase MutT (NUDIX family)